MNSKTIKISQENYKWLAQVAADIQKEKGELISLDQALSFVKSKTSHTLSSQAESKN